MASPFVTEYMVGYTRRRSWLRLNEYWKLHGYQYMVVLGDGLNIADAKVLEGYLQNKIWGSSKAGILYRKYNAARREGRHFPSVGPTSSIADDDKHAVYMAWYDKSPDQLTDQQK